MYQFSKLLVNNFLIKHRAFSGVTDMEFEARKYFDVQFVIVLWNSIVGVTQDLWESPYDFKAEVDNINW